MTTLQEAALTALAFIRWNEFGECRTPGFQGPTPTAAEAADALEDALAQQGEQQPVCHGCGIPAGDVHMSTCKSGKWPSRVSNGDTAAPAQKPVAYITQTEQGPMVWTPEMYNEACTYCDDGEFPIPLYTAAPEPQAQDKSDNYLSGYCTGRTDLLKEQSAQPVAQYDKTEMNAFVQDLYDKKMQEGKHGHYETMFHVVHKAIARVGIREVK